eukprot:scaffold36844_cov58-Phaeocystis_antarctica.AAC.5
MVNWKRNLRSQFAIWCRRVQAGGKCAPRVRVQLDLHRAEGLGVEAEQLHLGGQAGTRELLCLGRQRLDRARGVYEACGDGGDAIVAPARQHALPQRAGRELCLGQLGERLGEAHAEVELREVDEASLGAHHAPVARERKEDARPVRVATDGSDGPAVEHEEAREHAPERLDHVRRLRRVVHHPRHVQPVGEELGPAEDDQRLRMLRRLHAADSVLERTHHRWVDNVLAAVQPQREQTVLRVGERDAVAVE